jgi:hypothetical protein
MGKLFDYRNIIENKLKGMGSDGFKLKGQIGLKTGLLVGMISATTPDDPAQVKAMREAIKEVLGITV